jgi:putative ABC transport system ATP-binding protein
MTADLTLGAPVVTLRGVWKWVHSRGDLVPLVAGVDLEASPGELVCLTSGAAAAAAEAAAPAADGTRPGAGPALVSLLAGIERPTSGTVVVSGRDLAAMTDVELAGVRHGTVGLLPAGDGLVPFLPALDNVALALPSGGPSARCDDGQGPRRTSAREALALVGLGHRAHVTPAAMNAGEQRRTALARALVGCPPVLVADDPTAGLDARAAAAMVRLLRELCRRRPVAVVVSSDDPALAAHADRVVDLPASGAATGPVEAPAVVDLRGAPLVQPSGAGG